PFFPATFLRYTLAVMDVHSTSQRIPPRTSPPPDCPPRRVRPPRIPDPANSVDSVRPIHRRSAQRLAGTTGSNSSSEKTYNGATKRTERKRPSDQRTSVRLCSIGSTYGQIRTGKSR